MILIVNNVILHNIGNLKVKFVFVHRNSMTKVESVKHVYQVVLNATLKIVAYVTNLIIGNLMVINVFVKWGIIMMQIFVKNVLLVA
jgi:hypothetical protein